MLKYLIAILVLSCGIIWAQIDTANPNRLFANKFYELSTELENIDVMGAVGAWHKSRNYALKGGLHKLVARAEYGLSNCFDDMGMLDSANHYLNSALALTRKYQLEEPFPSMVLGNKGNVMAQMGMFDSALYYHEQALESLRPDDMEGVAYGLMNYASVLVYANQPDRARDHYGKALKIAVDSNYQDVVKTIIINMVVLENEQKGVIRPTLLDSLIDLTQSSNRFERYSIFQNLASLMLDQGKYGLAKAYLDSLQTADGDFVVNYLGGTSLTLARYYNLTGNYGKSLSVLRDLQNGPSLGAQKSLWLRRMGEAFAYVGEADSSSKYYNLAWELVEQENAQSIKQYVARSEDNIKVIEAQHQLEQGKLEQELLQVEIVKQRWWLVLLLIIGALIVTAFILLIRNVNNRRQLRDTELKHRQARITEMGLKLAQKNELIKELETKFGEQVQGASDEFTDWKRNVSSHLKKVANTERDWENMYRYFEDQYQGFYKNLKSKHPELTNNDLRLCTLARMRMSIKEMAAVLNLSVDSVKSNRYRLRKKMGLSTEVDLSDYLSGF